MTIEDKQTPEGWQAVNDGYGRWCYIKSDLGVLHSIPIGSSLQSVLVSYGSALAIGLVVGAILCWLHLHRVYFFERKVVQL
jgi:hypothetical protein